MDASRSRRSALRIPGTLVVTTAALALANMSGAAAATAEMRVPAECTGGNAIGMSLDSSGSVQQEFPTISRQVRMFKYMHASNSDCVHARRRAFLC